jgi:periplasmic mercuric ion binding protein
MKQINYLLSIVFISVMFFGCADQKAEPQAVSITEKVVEGDENSTVAFISLEGMSCEVGCARYINGKLAKLEGVLAAEVLFEDKLAKVSFDPEKLSGQKLADFVGELHDGQYKVNKVEVEKTIKKEVIIEENSSGNNFQAEQLEQVGIGSIKAIAFPNIFNLFKLKF